MIVYAIFNYGFVHAQTQPQSPNNNIMNLISSTDPNQLPPQEQLLDPDISTDYSDISTQQPGVKDMGTNEGGEKQEQEKEEKKGQDKGNDEEQEEQSDNVDNNIPLELPIPFP